MKRNSFSENTYSFRKMMMNKKVSSQHTVTGKDAFFCFVLFFYHNYGYGSIMGCNLIRCYCFLFKSETEIMVIIGKKRYSQDVVSLV